MYLGIAYLNVQFLHISASSHVRVRPEEGTPLSTSLVPTVHPAHHCLSCTTRAYWAKHGLLRCQTVKLSDSISLLGSLEREGEKTLALRRAKRKDSEEVEKFEVELECRALHTWPIVLTSVGSLLWAVE